MSESEGFGAGEGGHKVILDIYWTKKGPDFAHKAGS